MRVFSQVLVRRRDSVFGSLDTWPHALCSRSASTRPAFHDNDTDLRLYVAICFCQLKYESYHNFRQHHTNIAKCGSAESDGQANAQHAALLEASERQRLRQVLAVRQLDNHDLAESRHLRHISVAKIHKYIYIYI